MQKNREWLIGAVLVFLTLCGCFGAPKGVRAEESNATEATEATEPLAPRADRVPDAELVVTGRPGPKAKATGSGAGSRPGLDALLQLPNGYLGNSGSRPVAGASEPEWRRRFRKSEEELAKAQRALASTKQELDGVAEEGGANQWAVAPPGASGSGSGASSSPLSFKLRQALVRDRERVEGAEKALRELRIEADLAGVPVTWRSLSGVANPEAVSSSAGPGGPTVP